MVMKKKEFEVYFVKYRESLFEELQTLADYTLIYKQLILLINDPKSNQQATQFFWIRTIEAYLNSIIIWFSKLVDTNGKKGIFPFLRFVKSHHHFLSKKEYYKRNNLSEVDIKNCKIEDLYIETIEEDIILVERLNISDSIQTLRDKYYAHFDSKYFFEKEKLKIEIPFTIDDMIESIKILNNVLNKYSIQYDSEQKNIQLDKNYNLDNLFR